MKIPMRSLTSTMMLVGLLALSSCKSKLETKGDEYLEKGKFSQALQMYNKVDEAKKGSDEFADKYALALTKKMEEVAAANPEDEIINVYSEQIEKMAPTLKDKARAEEIAKSVIAVSKARVATQSFVQALNSFKLLDAVAPALSKLGISTFAEARKAMQDEVVKAALKKAENAPGSIGAEYLLTEGYHLVKDNEQLNKALNAVRKKNLNQLLIWSEEASGVNPSPLVNTNGYIFAFVNGSTGLTASGMSGSLLIWNTTGNNTELVSGDISVVGKDGKEVKNTAPVAPTCAKKFFNEKDCTTSYKISFPAGFEPLYVQISNAQGKGVKYLGTGL